MKPPPPQPFIPAQRNLPELSWRAVGIGLLCALLFGAGNVYLGLKIGMTVTAAISSVIVAIALIKGVFRGSILECTIVQSIGSSGDALLTGVIFTVPALLLMGLAEKWWEVLCYAGLGGAMGGVLGILFMIPLRKFLVVDEHAALPYPEGTACAKILVAAESGGATARPVFAGFGAGALAQFLFQALALWRTTMFWSFTSLHKASFGLEATPVMLGVGYIIGLKITLIMLIGGLLGWTIGIPVLDWLGGTPSGAWLGLSPEIAGMDAAAIGENYIRYVGAGAMALGGLISALKAIPLVVRSIRPALAGFFKTTGPSVGEPSRVQRDLPLVPALGTALLLVLALWILPWFGLGLFGALVTGVFAFLFVAVSARMVGMIGTTSQPVSGMTIAALMVSTLLLLLAGYSGASGRLAALTVGVMVCVSICTSGNISQDLKTGFLVGNTPARLQVAELVGTLFAALLAGGILLLFDRAWGLGSKELSAPQATIVKTIIEGAMGGKLPWPLLGAGAALALLVELLSLVLGRLNPSWSISSLALAIGLYLPVSTSATLIFGGALAWLVRRRLPVEQAYRQGHERAVLFSSGLIAGGAIMAVLYAVLKLTGAASFITLRDLESEAVPWIDDPLAILVFLGFAYLVYRAAVQGADQPASGGTYSALRSDGNTPQR